MTAINRKKRKAIATVVKETKMRTLGIRVPEHVTSTKMERHETAVPAWEITAEMVVEALHKLNEDTPVGKRLSPRYQDEVPLMF